MQLHQILLVSVDQETLNKSDENLLKKNQKIILQLINSADQIIQTFTNQNHDLEVESQNINPLSIRHSQI